MPAIAHFQRDKADGAHEHYKGSPCNRNFVYFLLFFVRFWKVFFHIIHSDRRRSAIHATNDHPTPSGLVMKPSLPACIKSWKSLPQCFGGALAENRTSCAREVVWRMYKNRVPVCSTTLKLFMKQNNRFIQHVLRTTRNAKIQCVGKTQRCLLFNLLATDFFPQILAHSVFKMWVIQKPNKVALWNKRHFEEKKMEIIQHV